MLPAVSSGPLDPAWSPDGKWIAFSMRGDIWKMPAEGGEAIALTPGPAYHFEPAWSPDGTTHRALDGHQRQSRHRHRRRRRRRRSSGCRPSRRVDIQPAWSRDGKSLFFVSARARRFRIFGTTSATSRHADHRRCPRIQPAVSPDGKPLAYVSRCRQAGHRRPLGRGRRPATPTLVHDEETEYRMEPAWTPDGQSILFSSERRGSNDIAHRAGRRRRSGRVSRSIASARDVAGGRPRRHAVRVRRRTRRATTLYTAPIAGGRAGAWTRGGDEVAQAGARRPAACAFACSDRTAGRCRRASTSMRSDGRHYTPDGGFHRSMMVSTDALLPHDRRVEVEVPAGATTIEAMPRLGVPARRRRRSMCRAGGVQTATIRLERLVDLPARGWYSGDTPRARSASGASA